MNLKSIEEKFQTLDKRDKEIRKYYNPRAQKGKQHQYIGDLKADFEYDSMLYGLGSFWSPETEEDEAGLSELPTIEPQKSPKKLPVTKKSQTKVARLKDQRVLDLQKPFQKDSYVGMFSNTKVLNTDYLYKSPYKQIEAANWKSSVEKANSPKSPSTELTKNQNSPFSSQVERRLKESKTDNSTYHKKPKDKVLKQEEFKKMLGEIETLLQKPSKPTPLRKRSKNLKTPLNKNLTQEPEVLDYRELCTVRSSSVRPTKTQHLLNHLPVRKNVLPKIESFITTQFKKEGPNSTPNPLTQVLFKYRKKADEFNPQAYPANLKIFESHDLMEKKYSKPIIRPRIIPQEPESLDVQGQSFYLQHSVNN